MPIYEYRCKNCRKEMSFIILSISNPPELQCKYCGGTSLSQLVSRFATPRSEESRLEGLADPGKLGDINENDPKSMARWMKRMGKEMGEDLGGDFDQAIEEAMEEEAAGGGEGDTPAQGGTGEW